MCQFTSLLTEHFDYPVQLVGNGLLFITLKDSLWFIFFNCVFKSIFLVHFTLNATIESMVISISETNYRSKALVFSSLVSKKIRWRVKFNVYNFFGGWKLNLVADCLFNKFTTGWITYTGCCENKYFAFFLFCLFSSVFFIESQRRLTHIIIELADQPFT